MTNQLKERATEDVKVTAPKLPEPSFDQGSMFLSVLALVVGIVALGLASIPTLALGRPMPNPFAGAMKEEPREEPAERTGGVTFKIKSFSVNFGGKVPEKTEPAEAPPKLTKDPVRWFTISAISCALVGLVIGAVGHLREKHTVLTIGSMGCCAAAITWQFLVIGIAVGVAAAVFLIVLAMLGSVMPA